MTHQLSGPFEPLPGCRLWLSEDLTGSDVGESGPHQEFAEAHLCDQDLLRWNRYRPPEKKRQFLNSRLAIQAVLKREFGTASDSYRVETIETGQPVLKHTYQSSLASISLSHTGNIAAIVVSDNQQGLGVDIEVVKPLNIHTLGLTFLNPLELDWLAKETLEKSPEMILAIWTLKEALWKALGGPRDAAMSEIIAEYHNSTLNGQRWTDTGIKQSAAAHFFGHRFSFPCALKNYSSIDVLNAQMPSFIGCIVLMDRNSQDNQ